MTHYEKTVLVESPQGIEQWMLLLLLLILLLLLLLFVIRVGSGRRIGIDTVRRDLKVVVAERNEGRVIEEFNRRVCLLLLLLLLLLWLQPRFPVGRARYR